jgi:hypothetical protein
VARRARKAVAHRFARIDASTIGVTASGGRRSFALEIDELGATR